MRVVSESEFVERMVTILGNRRDEFDFVTGPGRSGAIASVYASHLLGCPFLPEGQLSVSVSSRILVIDTAIKSGRTMRKTTKRMSHFASVTSIALFVEPPRVKFWYEFVRERL